MIPANAEIGIPTIWLGAGVQIRIYNWHTLLLGSNISWSCSTVITLCPLHIILLSFSSSAHPVNKMSHFHSSALPRLRQGIYCHHSLVRASLALPECFVFPSWNASFSDESLCMQFLHRMCPSWTGLSVHSSYSDWGPSQTSLPIN